jgi:hypothetical protein
MMSLVERIVDILLCEAIMVCLLKTKKTAKARILTVK